ncbi:MAG: type II toxin-antitoxin system HipA family toxin [Paludibacteraceae bacterium]|nr:type II toxin-antitoxin system HipA family toxin [Paludibacteraceae bacterium]
MKGNTKETALVKIWGKTVGYVSKNEDNLIAFQYDPSFVRSGIELSPFKVPLSNEIYSFARLNEDTFKGLPGFIADALPDSFGTSVLNQWLINQGRPTDTYSVIERLLFQGKRAMGALEFEPQWNGIKDKKERIVMEDLVQAAAEIMTRKSCLHTNMDKGEDALDMILKVGTSAGGARPKAIVAYNKETHELVSGVSSAPEGFEQYLLKLDVKIDKENNLKSDSSHYCRLEHSYYKMALACGIEMEECLLVDSGQRSHFLTKRFDRVKKDGREEKVHMVSLTGMGHYDFNTPRECSYEMMFGVMRGLRLPAHDMEQAFRRMVFNVVACNNDDHPKNFSFLLDKDSQTWRFSPAYDVTFAHKVGNFYIGHHQMWICGKCDSELITGIELKEMGREQGVKKAADIVNEIVDVVSHSEKYMDSRIPQEIVDRVKGEIDMACKDKQVKNRFI